MISHNRPTIEEGDQLLRLVRNYISFIMLAPSPNQPESRIYGNATCSFINTGSRCFGITNKHVIEEFRDLREEQPNMNFQIESHLFDIENNIIAECDNPDILTFEIAEEFMRRINKTFCPCRTWPPSRAIKDETIVFAGFPGDFRDQISQSAATFGIVAMLELVTGSSKNRFFIRIDRDNWIRRFGTREISELENLCGMSGSAVFREREINRIATLEPVGVIYAGVEGRDWQLAAHIDFIQSDGTIRSIV